MHSTIILESVCLVCVMKTITIAIIGTHCTRKTTLCHLLTGKLKEEGKNVTHLHEIATSCPMPINQETSVDAQLWILLNQIQHEIELSSKPYDYIVLDRCVLDNYAYFERAFVKSNSKEQSKMDMASNLLKQWINTYDFIFKTEMTPETNADGIRCIDPTFRQDIENRLVQLCSSLNLKTLHHISGTNEEKLNKMLSVINNRPKD